MKSELYLGAEKQILRAVVVQVAGQISVSTADESLKQQPCDLLETGSGAPFPLAPGDTVLVWWSGGGEERPVILGRVAPGGSPTPPALAAEEMGAMPEELVIEAKHALTLKCGDGSITLRADGKIAVRGTDLVSNALRMNRIKGGAVSIN